jgi:hypothetical protein
MGVRLIMVVEGDTEEAYANQVLKPFLAQRSVYVKASRVTTKGRRGGHLAQGGGRSYAHWQNDLTTWMKQDQGHDVWFTTMLDLYGLAGFVDAFPGYEAAQEHRDPYKRVEVLEEAWKADIGHWRFIPYLQLHEFEALILADPQKLDWFFIEEEDQEEIAALVEMVAKEGPPETINDRPEHAPSKRIIQRLPVYDDEKPRAGPLVADKIGLSVLRGKCPHFGEWLSKLESLSEQARV